MSGLICKCGYELSVKDIKPPLIKAPTGFYGGRVTRFTEFLCECGTKHKLMIAPKGQTWAVIDAEEITEEKGGEDLICEVCGKVCKSKTGYAAHLKTHANG